MKQEPAGFPIDEAASVDSLVQNILTMVLTDRQHIRAQSSSKSQYLHKSIPRRESAHRSL